LHLLAAMIERGVLSHERLHAPHPGRELGVLDIELLVGGELALAAMWTQIPGPRNFHRTQSGQYAARAEFAVTRLVATATGKAALLFGWLAEAQQLAEGGGAGMMESRTEGRLHRFQIRLARLLALGEDTSQQRGYFARDLVLDRLGRFFSSGVSVSCAGRARQIFSLTSKRSRLNSRNR
jgi:hypothetical protein